MNRHALVQLFIKLLGKHRDKKNIYSDLVDLSLELNPSRSQLKWTKSLNCELKEIDNSVSNTFN